MEFRWIGGSIAGGLLVVFLMIAYFVPSRTQVQHQILRFLCALAGAVLGAFLTGELVINVTGNLFEGAKIVLDASGAVALFVLVWLTYSGTVQYTSGANVTVVEDQQFGALVQSVARAANLVAELNGFTAEELTSKLRPGAIHCKDFLELLTALGKASTAKLPQYSVSQKGSIVSLTANR